MKNLKKKLLNRKQMKFQFIKKQRQNNMHILNKQIQQIKNSMEKINFIKLINMNSTTTKIMNQQFNLQNFHFQYGIKKCDGQQYLNNLKQTKNLRRQIVKKGLRTYTCRLLLKVLGSKKYAHSASRVYSTKNLFMFLLQNCVKNFLKNMLYPFEQLNNSLKLVCNIENESIKKNLVQWIKLQKNKLKNDPFKQNSIQSRLKFIFILMEQFKYRNLIALTFCNILSYINSQLKQSQIGKNVNYYQYQRSSKLQMSLIKICNQIRNIFQRTDLKQAEKLKQLLNLYKIFEQLIVKNLQHSQNIISQSQFIRILSQIQKIRVNAYKNQNIYKYQLQKMIVKLQQIKQQNQSSQHSRQSRNIIMIKDNRNQHYEHNSTKMENGN